ncbi:hypothetical protein BD31_I0578 [Candidatus Nitrosopumilus salaria BD31]|uniref:Uncharacterized protein n=1 Tax=Candidatus Nitrosopumilus salarius BD31 TaxID=859350 RepID=I3D303_9ARCH|nr:hypothetical protein [Candidatus Nitrosopumilus salaria]EIJ66096.1 hypothetical protein BD31_I0578 [Candidatus Nitrosopumilus salaria BD31]
MVQTIKLVFSNSKYLTISFIIFASMFVGLLILSEYVFLDPYVVSHLPPGSEFGLVLIVILSVLSALVIPMNIFRISILKGSKQKMSGSIFGSLVGSIAGACSCGPIGFAVISTFGSIGATTTAFLTNYEIPIRLAAIAILTVTYFTTVKSLKIECNLDS